jgi:hypothetical protein
VNGRSLASLLDIPPGHTLVPRHCHPTLPSGRVVIFRDSSEIRVRSDLGGPVWCCVEMLTEAPRSKGHSR